MNDRKPMLLGEREGTWLWWLGHPLRYLALGEHTDETYAISWGTVPVGQGPPPHRHDFEEGFYVQTGEVTFTAGNQTVRLHAGGFIHIGAGTAHALKNTGTTEAEVLVIVGPAGFDRFQREAGQVLTHPDEKGPPASSADLDRMRALGPRYGIDLDPPPSAFEESPNITVRQPGEGRAIAVVGDRYRFLAVSEDTGGKYALWEASIFPGGGPPPHIHRREEEGFFVLEGQVTFLANGQRHQARPGVFAHMPKGSLHAFKNETNETATMLIFIAPGGLERMFEQTGRLLNDPTEVPGPPSQEEIERLLAIAPGFGVEIQLPSGQH